MNELKIVKEIPRSIELIEIIRVINNFHKDSGLEVDLNGFLTQTLDRFAGATFLKNGAWDLWLCEQEGKIKSYFLCSVDKATDNKLAYFIHQGWLAQELRGNGYQHSWWKDIKARAKELLCNQIFIHSVRNFESYKRLLGDNLTRYSELYRLSLEEV